MIALVALVLTLANSAYEVWQWLQGAEPRLLSPEQVLLIPDEYPTGHTFLRLAARFSYVNSGPPRQNAIVLAERLSFSTGEDRFVQHWQSFESFQGQSCDLESVSSEDVHPVVIGGRDSASHVTYFAPRARPHDKADEYRDFVTIATFLELLEAASAAFRVELTAELDSAQHLHYECSAVLTDHEKDLLRDGCAVTLACREDADGPNRSQG